MLEVGHHTVRTGPQLRGTCTRRLSGHTCPCCGRKPITLNKNGKFPKHRAHQSRLGWSLPASARTARSMEPLVESAMQTPDGLWRVEVVRRRGQRTSWFRIVRDDVVLDWLSISAVERILAESGVDLGTLVPVADTATAEDPEQTPGPSAHRGLTRDPGGFTDKNRKLTSASTSTAFPSMSWSSTPWDRRKLTAHEYEAPM